MNTVFIYGLNCPVTGRTRYVGKSIDPFDRLHGCGGHVSYAKAGEDTHKAKWIRSLLANSQEPVIEILDEVPTAEWQLWEKEWIRLYRAFGFCLTNATMGGDGVPEMSKEIRAKISVSKTGTKCTLATRAKMSAAHSGEKNSNFVVNNTSGALGIIWDKSRGKWQARLKDRALGRFSKKEDAIFARNLVIALGGF